jgi:hypothetical protein
MPAGRRDSSGAARVTSGKCRHLGRPASARPRVRRGAHTHKRPAIRRWPAPTAPDLEERLLSRRAPLLYHGAPKPNRNPTRPCQPILKRLSVRGSRRIAVSSFVPREGTPSARWSLGRNWSQEKSLRGLRRAGRAERRSTLGRARKGAATWESAMVHSTPWLRHEPGPSASARSNRKTRTHSWKKPSLNGGRSGPRRPGKRSTTFSVGGSPLAAWTPRRNGLTEPTSRYVQSLGSPARTSTEKSEVVLRKEIACA